MTEIECVETLQYLLGYENAVDKGELDLPNYLNSEEKEALKFILAEIQQYRAIGTVEEFKALKEKSVAKKPIDVRYFGEAGYYIGLCPTCKSGNNSEYPYCGDCGQKLDR